MNGIHLKESSLVDLRAPIFLLQNRSSGNDRIVFTVLDVGFNDHLGKNFFNIPMLSTGMKRK